MRQYAYMQDDGSYKMFRRAARPCVRFVSCSKLFHNYCYWCFELLSLNNGCPIFFHLLDLLPDIWLADVLLQLPDYCLSGVITVEYIRSVVVKETIAF